MSNDWLEIHLSIPDEAVDLASQVLIELGSSGVTVADKALDTFVVPSPEDLANDPILKAYFQKSSDAKTLCDEIYKGLQALTGLYPELSNVSIQYKQIDGQDWANNWKQHFPPFKVGDRLVICPSWTDWQSSAQETVLTLDPGQAFGTGTHATTSLCLDAIAEIFASNHTPQSVLDVGTGSGILAMAAAALGAQEVLATDIDQVACEVAEKNINVNQLQDRITTTETSLEELPGSYDLVLANILAAENIRLSSEFVRHMNPGGKLILSGILIEQEEQVLKGFETLPLSLESTAHRDEWTCIVYQRHE